MPNTTHSLLKEFPQYIDAIHELKATNVHFAKLLENYNTVDKELFNIETELETPSDSYTEDLKKKRLKLKDELLAIIKNRKAA